jgi:hypothetical protein
MRVVEELKGLVARPHRTPSSYGRAGWHVLPSLLPLASVSLILIPPRLCLQVLIKAYRVCNFMTSSMLLLRNTARRRE